MKITIHISPNPQLPHHKEWIGAIAEGFAAHGIAVRTRYDFEPTDCDLAIFWSHNARVDKIKEKQLASSKDYLALERGYSGNRYQYSSVGFNGPARLGEYCNKNSKHDRIKKLKLDIKPWKTGGDYILLLGQVPNDAALRGLNLAQWTAEVKEKISKITNKEVRFRPHPIVFPNNPKTLAEDLDGAAVVITYNSTSGVDAVMHGVPAITLDRASMAWDVSGHSLDDILDPPTPDRSQWLADLAYTQWTLAEISSGKCWKHLSKYYA